VLRACNDGLLHVSVFDRDDPSRTLAALDESGAALEAAVGHATLLTTVEHNGHTVAFGVVVHDAGDVDAGSLGAAAAKDAAGTDTETM
tara:strand:+ start:4896 stop:5159 length:264 start_codon:yes stop_codon:yes gene_type:complete